MAFLGWLGHYLIVFAVLAIVAGLGIFAGKKWNDHSTAKKAEEAKEADEAE